ncbi:hypothetical protein ACELLULO517_24695 [Acidisoma cellulosilytica]|uniref:Uncharacterized protein n=1 Tax=Acidisoma cellulosilyticum TaxID=2802395 RepID=A0A964E691_9PROT|nr:hypothetical protein [Acidisoma cellulosilyticum]MCB8883470.1 hypothetical protein [Acidisoma cellulosilyticum]
MAAFGAAPIRYRASQERAVTGDESASRAFETAALRPTKAEPQLKTENPAPGVGGHVREVFPLLSRAVPAVADVSVASVKRVGDDLPLPPEPEAPLSPFDQALAEQAHGKAASLPDAASPAQPHWAAAESAFVATPVAASVAAPAAPVSQPQPSAPLPALRSHADLIQRLSPQPAAPQPAPTPPAPVYAAPQAPAPHPAAPAYAAPQPAAPQPAAPQPAYYPAPPPPMPAQAAPQPGYAPGHPQQAYPPQPGYPQPGYPPQAYPPGYPPPGYPYPQPGAGYPPPYPPQPAPYAPPGYAPGYPPGYPPQAYPPGYPPPAYPYPPAGAAPYGGPPAPYPPPPQPAPTADPVNLAEVFAALQRARGGV